MLDFHLLVRFFRWFIRSDDSLSSGNRGFGSPYTHQTWGVGVTEYLKTKANEEIIVCVQIESRDAVENLEEIAQAPGVGQSWAYFPNSIYCKKNLDVLFIGPFDLSLSLGFPTPNPDPHPEIEKVIQRIKSVAHKYGKKV